MTNLERVAYIRGLAEGLELDIRQAGPLGRRKR